MVPPMTKTLTKTKQLIYACGSGGFSLLDNLFGVYLIFFFLPPKETGMPELIDNKPMMFGLTIIGLIILFGRTCDSFIDPLIASWSDNSKSKLGRRRFFTLTGALPFSILAALLFFPPDDSASANNAWYVAGILTAYFFFYSYFMTPYLSLIPELSSTQKDRLFLTIMQAVFSLTAGAAVMLGMPQLWTALKSSGWFTTDRTAFQASAVIICILGFFLTFISTLPVEEKQHSGNESADVGLFTSLKMTITNPNFILYVVGALCYWCSFNMIRSMIAYYPMVVLHKEASFQTILMAVLFGSAALVFITIGKLAGKVSMKLLMLIGLFLFAIFQAVVYIIPSFSPEHIVTAGIIHMALMGLPVGILLVVPNAILSDICEVDGYKTGKKREAMFFGAQGFFLKINYGLAVAITAYLFAAYGKDVSNPNGVLMTGPAGSILCIIGFIAFLFYPQKRITAELEKHRK